MSVAEAAAPPAAVVEDGPDLLTGFRFPPGYIVGPDDEGKRISREEFGEIAVENGWKIERAGGRLVLMPRAGRPHRRCGKTFRFELNRYWMSHLALVEDVEAERWVDIEDDTDRVPDTAVLLKDSPLAGDDLDPGRVPDVLFEFVSPGAEARERDYEEKRAEYHRLGVREYVIVDPAERRVTVLRWEADGYAEAAVLGPADSYTSSMLPGLEIPLSEAIGDAG